MTKTILGGFVLGAIMLASCSKPFELNTPLHPRESTNTSLPIVYFRTSDLTVGNVAPLGTITVSKGVVSDFTAPEVYVYLTKPAPEDLTLKVKVNDSDAVTKAYAGKMADGMTYVTMPSSAVTVGDATVSFKKGTKKSDKPVKLQAASGYSDFMQAQLPNRRGLVTLTLEFPESKLRLSRDYGHFYLPYTLETENLRSATAEEVGTLSAIPGDDLKYQFVAVLDYETWTYPPIYYLYDNNLSTSVFTDSAEDNQYFYISPKGGGGLEVKGLYLSAPESIAFEELMVYASFDGKKWVSQGTIDLIPDKGDGKKNYYLFKSPVKASFFMIQPATPNSKKKFGFSELHLLK